MKHQFDSPNVRRAIGEFYLGIDDFQLYQYRMDLKHLQNQESKLKTKYSSTRDFLVEAELPIIFEEVKGLIDQKEIDYKRVYDFIHDLENTEPLSDENTKEVDEKYVTLCSKLTELKTTLNKNMQEYEGLVINIEDSEHFIVSLADSLQAFLDSRKTQSFLGEIKFSRCPSCLSPLNGSSCEENTCYLCKAETSASNKEKVVFRVQFELENQIRESKALLVDKNKRVKDLKLEIAHSKSEIRELEERVQSFVETPDPIEANLINAYKNLGAINEEFKRLQKHMLVVKKFNASLTVGGNKCLPVNGPA